MTGHPLFPKDNPNGIKTRQLLLFLVLIIGLIVFVGSITHTAFSQRKIPTLLIDDSSRALRGSIVSSDGFTLSSSQKLYKVMVNTRNIDPGKVELFTRLFAIYSGIDEATVKKRIKASGNVVLSYNIDASRAKYLKDLSGKLRALKVFVAYMDRHNRPIVHELDITESGEQRHFPYHDLLTPVIGYMRKTEEDGFTRPRGVKGLEKAYEESMAPIQNGLVHGERDLSNSIILDGSSTQLPAIDGMDLHLYLSLSLQKRLEKLMDTARDNLDAKEVMGAVMESRSGAVVALATSSRYDPMDIRQSDIPRLNPSVAEYTFEPGSVMKSVTFALLLHNRKVNPYDIVRTYGGRYKLGRRIIRDEHKEQWMSAENVIVYSSNIGTAQLAQRLDAREFYEGLHKFGFARKSGIDLSLEHAGLIPSERKMDSQTYKATVGYGYGLRVNFMQLLDAYNVFNNGGVRIAPRIVSHLVDVRGKRFEIIPPYDPIPVISDATAARIRRILQKVVAKGTGVKAQVEGLYIGGKTGTAHIASNRRYVRRYNSSFFGFANDRTRRYTIGVVVREPKKPYSYFASESAVPLFKQIVETLIEQEMLHPAPTSS